MSVLNRAAFAGEGLENRRWPIWPGKKQQRFHYEQAQKFASVRICDYFRRRRRGVGHAVRRRRRPGHALVAAAAASLSAPRRPAEPAV